MLIEELRKKLYLYHGEGRFDMGRSSLLYLITQG